MRNRKRWKARTGVFFKGLVVVTLTLVSVRSGVYVYKSFADEPPDPKVVQEQKEIPSSARGTAELFLWNWYYTAPKETVQSKRDRIAPFISRNVAEKLRAKNVIPMSQMEPLRVESWDEIETGKWIEEGKRAVLTFMVMLKDGRNLYVSVPVVKAGAWQVDGLPALLPETSKESAPTLEANIDQNVLDDIHSSLDAFFPMWLLGKEEANNRYVIGKLPLDNVLGKVQGVYEEVAIQPIKEKPVTVKALVKIRTAEEEMFFEYTIVLEKVDNQWKIKELN